MSPLFINTQRRGSKTLQILFAYARLHSWRVSRTNGGHLRFSKPGRPIIHTCSTPSDWRAVRNALAMLARADREKSEMMEAVV